MRSQVKMSSSAKVTITLGQNRQVVKSVRPVPDVGQHQMDLREKLNCNRDQNKRQRTVNGSFILDDDAVKEIQAKSTHQIDRNDLRLKLVNKRLSRNILASKGQSCNDLREKLSRQRKVSFKADSNQTKRRHNARESARDRKRRESGRLPHSWQTVRKLYAEECVGELHARKIGSPDTLGRFPPIRNSEDLLHLDLWNHNSLDKVPNTSRASSPPPRSTYERLRQDPISRFSDSSRTSNFLANGATDPSRSVTFTQKTTASAGAAGPGFQAPPSTGITQKNILKIEKPITVSSLLSSLGLEKYEILFRAEEVDMTTLEQMKDSDLKEMGIPLGPRKKILLTISSIANRQR